MASVPGEGAAGTPSASLFTALAIIFFAAAFVTGILPDPLGLVLPLVFVLLMIVAIYLRFRLGQGSGPGGAPRRAP